MTAQDPKNLRSRFYLSEIARWLLVMFFLLVLVLYYVSSGTNNLEASTYMWLVRLRDLSLGAGLILLALGNFLRLNGTPMHQKLRWFWLILAIVFTIYWLFKGQGYFSNQLA